MKTLEIYTLIILINVRLNLPGEIEENDASTGDYDCDKGNFTLKFSKVNKGEHFENLDMITSLLAPSKKKKNPLPTIEVISKPVILFNSICIIYKNKSFFMK